MSAETVAVPPSRLGALRRAPHDDGLRWVLLPLKGGGRRAKRSMSALQIQEPIHGLNDAHSRTPAGLRPVTRQQRLCLGGKASRGRILAAQRSEFGHPPRALQGYRSRALCIGQLGARIVHMTPPWRRLLPSQASVQSLSGNGYRPEVLDRLRKTPRERQPKQDWRKTSSQDCVSRLRPMNTGALTVDPILSQFASSFSTLSEPIPPLV